MVFVYKHLSTCLEFMVRTILEEYQVKSKLGVLVYKHWARMGSLLYGPFRESSEVKDGLVLVYKHLGTYGKLIVRIMFFTISDSVVLKSMSFNWFADLMR